MLRPQSELSALRRDGSQLYSYLIAPVEQRLDTARTLVIEAEGWLGGLPFEALPDAGGRYLVERGAIVHSLGLYSDEALRADVGIHASSPTLIVASGASWEGRGLKPIPDVAGEADTVAHRFPEAHVLNGATVTLNSVMKALPATEVFHFTGHSVATSSDAGLLLEGPTPETGLPRMLDGNQTRHMHLPKLQLAVLSACSTGADSTGFSNVTEALLRIGVPHVVASRWSVDSVETRRFVEGFYDNLLSGVPVSEATRIASRKMLSNSRTAHPYYWSTFVAFGQQ